MYPKGLVKHISADLSALPFVIITHDSLPSDNVSLVNVLQIPVLVSRVVVV